LENERKELSMKKFLVILMVALVALALVACGDEAPTTTKGTSATTTPAVTTPKTEEPAATTPVGETTKTPGETTKTPGETAKTPNSTEEPGNNDNPGTVTPPDSTAPFTEGIDILNGDYEYMAIDPTWKGLWACAFEDHQPDFNYKWCFVVKMIPTEEFVQEELIVMDEEAGFGEALEDYTWTLIINDEEFVITEWSIPQRDGFIYVRMGLGDWAPAIGDHEYDIKLKITETSTNKIIYWAWFSDPNWSGLYPFTGKEPIKIIPTEKPEDVEALPAGSLTGISGPESLAATETYAKLFDDQVRTKLCSSDYTNPLIFTVSNASSIKGISLVGANDDEKFPERVPVKFKLYGSDDGSDASWSLVLDVNNAVEDIEVTNYGEHYYGFTEAVEYSYFKLVIEDASGAATPKYQYSEILLYTDKQ